MQLRATPFLALALLAAPILGQRKADATLYSRVDGDTVRAVIEVEIEHGWHLYHGPTQEDLGHPEAVGQPTRIELGGEGITWGPVEFPEPYAEDQSIFGEGVFIYAHEGNVLFRATGRLAGGATGDDVQATLKGLVCEESCIPYNQTVRTRGAGPDELFAESGGDDETGDDSGADPEPAAPAADDHRGGNADATLYTRVVDGRVQVAIEIDIDFDWHLYHGPTKADLGHPDAIGEPTTVELHGAGITFGPVQFPEPYPHDQSELGEGIFINSHEGSIVLFAQGVLADGADGSGVWAEIKGQTCDPMLCVQYAETVVSRGEGRESVWVGFEAPAPADPSDPSDPGGTGGTGVTTAAHGGSGGGDGNAATVTEEKPLWLFLLAAIGGGLFALAMPCTYPMIPITISFFTKQADARGGSVLPLSLAYGAGIVGIFVLVGVVFGSLIIPFATHPVTNLVIGIAFLYFALVLFGIVDLQPPRFLMNAAGQASMKGGFLGVFLMGATLVVTSFTCTAPFVGTILSFGASGGGLGRVALGMGVFGLTMAIPFVLLSLVPGRIRAMPKSGEWMNTLKVTLGFVEVAAALKFFSNSDVIWEWNLLSRELFLLLWAVIFLAAALYLFGVFSRGKGVAIGPRRLGSAGLLAVLSVYCLWGMTGKKLDFVMTAIAPNYSGGVLGLEWYSPGGSWAIVKDDYDGAIDQARDQGKLVLTNFTGFT